MPIFSWWRMLRGNDWLVMAGLGPGFVKTKSDLVVMPSRGRIFAFFSSAHDHRAQKFRVRLYRVEFSHSLGHQRAQQPPKRAAFSGFSVGSRWTIDRSAK